MPSPTHNESGVLEKSLNGTQTLHERFHGLGIPSTDKIMCENLD